jgi:PIN domain nuclease of toxin-antitoxin system
MRLLLDTHVWLWLVGDPDRITSQIIDTLADTRNELLLSAASSWEIAIKFHLGKLLLPDSPDAFVPSRLRATGTTPLPVEHAHVLATVRLPWHHRDPFDRLLIAQAQILQVPIVTADRHFDRYDVSLIRP